jgi:hypothetical protein
MMVDDNVLVCARVTETPEPAKGSVKARCFLCDQPVWVGPNSLVQKPINVPVVCMYCVENCQIVNRERTAS